MLTLAHRLKLVGLVLLAMMTHTAVALVAALWCFLDLQYNKTDEQTLLDVKLFGFSYHYRLGGPEQVEDEDDE